METRREEGILFAARRADGLLVTCVPQLFAAALLTLGPAHGATYDYQWMYSADVGGLARAVAAMYEWLDDATAEEPEGWVRSDYHAPPGLWRRRPGGDRAREEVRA